MKFSLLPKMLLCLGLSGVFAVAQETVESVRRQIKAVEAETAREKSMHEAEKKRHAEFVEVGRKKVQALSAQNKSLKAEIDSLNVELKKISAARGKTNGSIRLFEGKKTAGGIRKGITFFQRSGNPGSSPGHVHVDIPEKVFFRVGSGRNRGTDKAGQETFLRGYQPDCPGLGDPIFPSRQNVGKLLSRFPQTLLPFPAM